MCEAKHDYQHEDDTKPRCTFHRIGIQAEIFPRVAENDDQADKIGNIPGQSFSSAPRIKKVNTGQGIQKNRFYAAACLYLLQIVESFTCSPADNVKIAYELNGEAGCPGITLYYPYRPFKRQL
jgi:hypothetical protein